METYLICLAVALIGGLMLSRLTKLIHLPAVTAYLMSGLLLGPFYLREKYISITFHSSHYSVSHIPEPNPNQ